MKMTLIGLHKSICTLSAYTHNIIWVRKYKRCEMINYKKPKSLITILNSKHDFFDAYSREVNKAKRHQYPISSLNIVLPEKMSNNKNKIFIIDSFREADIVYYNHSSKYLQVLLPYTPQEHLDIIISRINTIYNSMKYLNMSGRLQCEKLTITKDSSNDINTLISVLDKADNLANEDYNIRTPFSNISGKLLNIVRKKSTQLNFINNYCGLKVNYKAILVNIYNDKYIFETDPMQLAAMKNSAETLVEIKKYGFHISAAIENIDFVLNRVTLKNLLVMTYNNIYPSALTVGLKEPLPAVLISLGSTASIELSAVSFNEIHGHGDISNLVIDNNTLRLVIRKNKQEYTLLVKFVYSKFNGTTQDFILTIMDDSEKSLELFQSIVTKRSRECIQELKQFIA